MNTAKEPRDGGQRCGAIRGATQAETACQSLGTHQAHLHSGGAEAGIYPLKNIHLLLRVFTRSPLSCLSKMRAVPHQGRNVFLPPFLF